MSRAFTKERDDAPEPERFVPRHRVDAIPPPPADPSVVGYSARVTVSGMEGGTREFAIVAPDGTDIAAGRLAIDSPLAAALMGHRRGDRVVWHRPAGDRELVIVDVRYVS